MICRYKIKFISDIEQKIRKLLVNIAVAPFVGVWIEIVPCTYLYPQLRKCLRSGTVRRENRYDTNGIYGTARAV